MEGEVIEWVIYFSQRHNYQGHEQRDNHQSDGRGKSEHFYVNEAKYSGKDNEQRNNIKDAGTKSGF